MQTIKIIAVGKLKENYLNDAEKEYLKRLSRFCEPEIIEVSDFPDQANSLKREAKLILPKLSGEVYPLCIEGSPVSSEKFLEFFKDKPLVTFVIGGSNGLDREIKTKGRPLSLSKLTFPHQITRILLLEQIYRGFKIMNNEKYHK